MPWQPASTHVVKSIPSCEIVRHAKEKLTEELFLRTWSKGEPLLVEGVQTRQAWDPAKFIEVYGNDECEISRCDGDGINKTVRVRDFFRTFGMTNAEKRDCLGPGIWKLKVS